MAKGDNDAALSFDPPVLINVYIPARQHRWLKAVARERGVSVSALIRELLERAHPSKPKHTGT